MRCLTTPHKLLGAVRRRKPTWAEEVVEVPKKVDSRSRTASRDSWTSKVQSSMRPGRRSDDLIQILRKRLVTRHKAIRYVRAKQLLEAGTDFFLDIDYCELL